MKLISCYIENFGGLQNFSLNFDSGITVVNEPNGFGKTTLATFIRAMLYGFDSKDRLLRKKYTPWQSGMYGGNLVFEYKDEKYRVERTFGATQKTDRFALYKLDPMTKCEDFSENLGQDIFGLDSASFERSTYMPQIREDNKFSTANIQAKLGNLVEDTNDVNNFDKAVELLRKARSGFKHYRGDNGSVADAQRKIAELELRTRELKGQKNLLQQSVADAQNIEKEIVEIDLRIKKLREEISLAFSVAVRKELEKQYTKLLEEKKEIEEQLDEYSKSSKNAPNEEDFRLCREKLEKLTADKTQLATVEKELQNIGNFENLPTEQEIDENKEKLSKIDTLRRENSRSVADTQPKKTSKTAIPFVIVGIILVIAAIVLFVLSKYAIGAAVAALGAVSLIGAVYFGIKDMVSSKLISADNVALKETEDKIQKLETEVREFAKKYNAEEENLFDAVNGLKIRLEIAQKNQKNLSEKQRLSGEISSVENEIVCFLSDYVEISEKENLAEKLTQLQVRTHQDKTTYQNLLKRKETNALQLAEFVEQNGEELKTPVSEENVDTDELKQKETALISMLNEKNYVLSNLKSRIRTMQNEVDTLPEIEDEIERLDKEKKDGTRKAELLDKTIDFLSNARDSLSTNYLGDIKKNFVHYIKQLSEETGDTVFVDKNLEVTLERGGVARNLENFSAGYYDIITLCMRFALVDALFPETKPFIILDDPFVNLDDSNTEKAITLLKKLGEDRQIIYLVCNSSRSV